MSISHLLESIIKIRKQVTCPNIPGSLSEMRQQSIQEKFDAKCALAFIELTNLKESIISKYGEKGAGFLQITLQELTFPQTLQKQINSDTKAEAIPPSTLSEKLLPLCEMAYQNEEKGVATLHANKLATIFEKYQDILDYLITFKKHNNVEDLIHDACLFELPDAEACNFKVWKKLASTHLANPCFRDLLPHATEIEAFCLSEKKQQKNIPTNKQAIDEKIKEITSTSKTFKALKTNPSPIQEATRDKELANLSIKSAQLSHELAQLCKGMPLINCNITILDAFYKEYLRESKDHHILVKHGISKASIRKFNQLTPRNDDALIPNLFIKIPKDGYEHYYLKKLDVLDKEGAALAACLGKITDCCQYIGGAGSSCAEYGISSPYSGFYVVCKGNPDYPELSDEIVAQSWVWRSKVNALVFDSIEVSKNGAQCPVMPFFNQLTQQLVAEGHTHKVACGSGSGIAKRHGVIDVSAILEEPIDYAGYSDAMNQRVLADVNRPFFSYQYEHQTKSLIKDLIKRDIPFNENRMLQDLISYLLFNKKDILGFIYESLFELSLTDKKVELDETFTNILSTSGLLNDINNVKWLLSSLQGVHSLIFESIKNNLPNLIKNTHHFCTLFALLPLEQQSELFNLVKKNIPGIINDKDVFKEVFSLLPGEQRGALFGLLKNNLPNLIQNTYHFCTLFALLPLEQQSELFNLVKKNLPGIINDKYEFEEVFALLSGEQRLALLGRLKNNLPNLITDTHGLVILFRYLIPAQRIEVLHIMKDNLSSFLTAKGLFSALNDLSPEEITLLDNVIKDISPKIIKTTEDFNTIIDLPSAKCIAFLNSTKNSFPYIVKNGKQLNTVIKLLPEQHTEVLEIMKESLRNLIETCDEFTEIFKELSFDNRLVFFNNFKEGVPFLINNMDDFEAMQASLSFISTEPLKILLEVMENCLYRSINTHDDFIKMQTYLSPVQRNALCEQMSDSLCSIVHNTEELHSVLQYFTPEQIFDICKSIKISQPKILKSSDDFATLLKLVPQDHIFDSYNEIKFSLGRLLNNSNDLVTILQPLPLEPMRLICKNLGRGISLLIKKSNDITCLFQPLTPQQITVVGVWMKEHLPKVIKNSNEFIAMITPLEPEQIIAVCEVMTKNMPRIFKSKEDLITVLKHLTPEQIRAICTAQKDCLLKLIKDQVALETIRANISKEQGNALTGLINCSSLTNNFTSNQHSFFSKETREMDCSSVREASCKL